MDYQDIQNIKTSLWAETADVELAAVAPARKIVAEGDSWFDYPFELDVLDNLKRDWDYKIYRVAEAGDTLENMAWGTDIRRNFSRRTPEIVETLDAVLRHSPNVVLLSGGGNDIAGEELEGFLNHKDSGLPVICNQCVDHAFNSIFKNAYLYIAQKIWDIDASIHIIAHGYGYAVPDGRAVFNFPGDYRFIGPWLRPAFAKKNITDPVEAETIMRQLIDVFNEMLDQLDSENQNFHYVNLRPVIDRSDWVNELHLSSDGYKRVAKKIHQLITTLV